MATPKAPSKALFYESLEYVIKNGAEKGEKIIRQNIDAPKATKISYESKIRTLAPEYKKSKKAIKEISFLSVVIVMLMA